ncbi:MAG: hypothetical protein ACRC62_13875 [Microcoleus sp.]
MVIAWEVHLTYTRTAIVQPIRTIEDRLVASILQTNLIARDRPDASGK